MTPEELAPRMADCLGKLTLKRYLRAWASAKAGRKRPRKQEAVLALVEAYCHRPASEEPTSTCSERTLRGLPCRNAPAMESDRCRFHRRVEIMDEPTTVVLPRLEQEADGPQEHETPFFPFVRGMDRQAWAAFFIAILIALLALLPLLFS